MDNETNLEIANKIAELIISKSFWGDEWFAFFSLLLVGLIAAAFAWAGAYLSTRSQNSAMRADFKKALRNLEIQTNSVKKIEEGIAPMASRVCVQFNNTNRGFFKISNKYRAGLKQIINQLGNKYEIGFLQEHLNR